MQILIRRTTAYLLTAVMLVSQILPVYGRAETVETLPQETLAATEPSWTAETATLPEEQTFPMETEETLPGETEETFPVETEETIPPETEEFSPKEYDYPQEIPDDFVAPISRTGEAASVFGLRIPAAYDSREANVITPVRDQESWQLCWAFSALAVGESYLLSGGQGRTDLSERHLGYFFHGHAADPLGNAAGDGTYLTEDYLISGNNNKFTTFALANWVGAAEEEKYPYDEDPSQQENTSAMDDTAHLSNAYWINAQDTDSIKYYIMRNGSVGLSIFYQDRYYNPRTAAYYNNVYTATNHAITVVGWDDSYPAENFPISPETDGAWLCKNSHGTEFGMDGFFWLSYRDAAISHASATVFVFEFEPGNNYHWNYHHDGSFGTSTRTIPVGGSVASIYTASGSDDGTDEQIRAVGFAVADADLTYRIQIYRDLTDPDDPTSGLPALSRPQEGQTSLCGFYSIPLEEPVTVRWGESFSVVVTLSGGQFSNIRCFVDRSYTNGSWIRFVSNTGPGRTFASDVSGRWTDLVEENVAARVKAYTVRTDSRSVSRLVFETPEILLAPGETFFQEPGRIPENADPCAYLWHSDREQIASVSEDGTVTAVDTGDTVITACTPDGRVSASYRVSVKPKLSYINLRRLKTEMTVGESFVPDVELYPASAAPYYDVTLESSDESVVAVSDQSLLARSPGTATVTVWAKPYFREYTVTVTRSLRAAQVTAEPAVYTGSPLEPAVSVVLEGVTLEKDRDYTLTCTNNILPGTGNVTVTGMGEYSGNCQTGFDIRLPETRILFLENENDGIRVTWEPCPGLTGYTVYRKTNDGGWKKAKTVTRGYSWLDKSGMTSGNQYTYKIVPYLKAGSKTFKAAESPEMTLCRLSTPKITEMNLMDSGTELRWKKVSGADAYRILRCAADSPEVLAAAVTDGTLSWTDTSAVETGIRYTYRIVAQNRREDTVSLSGESQPRAVCRPAVPENLTAVNTAAGIRLTWEAVDYATGYEIYRSANGTKWTKAKTLSGNSTVSWSDTSRSSGSQWQYRIRARVKLDGTVYFGDFSETQSIVRLSRPSVKKISAADDSFTMTWNRISGADGYRIYRSADGGPQELLAVIENVRTLSYTDQTAVETGTVYTYSLAAWKTVDGQVWLSEISGGKTAVRPDATAKLTVQESGKGKILLQWEPVANATGYEIYRSSNGTKWTKIKTVSGNEPCSWTDKTSGGIRYYRIRTRVKLDGTIFYSVPSEEVPSR